jgi:hypothetical protein
MKKQFLIVSILLLLCGISAAGAATITATNPTDAAALVYVSGYDINPQVFYPGETGTLTVHVTNAANASVSVSQPNLLDPHLHVDNQGAYTTATNIGPGASADFSFIFTVNAADGTYFPLFTVSPNAWGSSAIHAPIRLRVDSTDVRASISKRPDTFSVSKKDTVNVSVVNPRLGDITDVLIIESDTGTDVSPAEKYIGTIPAGGSVEVPFQVTPSGPDTVFFNVTFRNGDNHHTVSTVLPLNIGTDKMAAIPIINNVALVNNGVSYTLTGDVTNSGVTDATGVVLTTTSPANPVEPYTSYAVGALASNDFSSFTLSFSSNDLSSVPVRITWKDGDGNTFTATNNLDLRTLGAGTGSRSGSTSGSTAAASSASGTTRSTTSGSFQGGPPGGGNVFSFGGSRGGGLSSFYPLIAGAVIIIIAVVLWMKRKWIVAKLKKKQ